MSLYFKKFIILKKLNENCNFNCAVKIESDKNVTTVSGEILSSAFINEELLLGVKICSQEPVFTEVKNRKFNFVVDGDGEQGFSSVLLNKHDFSPYLAGSYNQDVNVQNFSQSAKAQYVIEKYDDEVIATENYFEGEKIEEQTIFSVDNGRNCQNQESAVKKEEESRTLLYEKLNDSGQKFIQTVERKLDEILQTHPEDSLLKSLIPESVFVKINYEGEKFYSVGKVLEKGIPSYVCYAVPGKYSDAPEQLKNYCSFLPVNPYNPLGEGYYVIFQSAKDGKLILKNL